MKDIIFVVTFIINFICGYSFLNGEVIVKEGECIKNVSQKKYRHRKNR